MIGTRLGAYEITGKLGEGGMGEVYRATDSRLKRQVAIKVLPAAFTADHERLARFEREAQLLAQLQHPHIASIYGLEESGGVRALVMELVDGEDLSSLIARGALPLEEALPIARQIAEALEAAHEQGIVHRDLKPANVKVRPDGSVKVLDFGLAKALAPAGALSPASDLARSPTLMNSPTLTTLGTQLGVILGTAAYMSPEQAKGTAIDKRADIWAFGVVLYEMLSGDRLFAGDSSAEVLASVLKDEIDLDRLPAATPPRVRRLLTRCLMRDRRQRLHDIADARLELEDAAGADAPLAAAPTPRPPMAALVGLGVVVGALLGALLWRTVVPGERGQPSPTSNVRLSIVPPPGQELMDAQPSPDGRTVALLLRPRGDRLSRTRIYLRPLDRFAMEPIPDSDGAFEANFSEDSRWLYFLGPLSAGATQLRLARVPVDGGSAPVTVRRWKEDWGRGSWTVLGNGDVLTTTEGGRKYVRLPAGGADPQPARPFASELTGARFNFMDERLGDGSPLLRVSHYGSRGYQNAVATFDPESGQVRLLVDDAFNGVPLASGQLLFGRGDGLLVAPFDAATRTVTDAPRSVLTGVRTSGLSEPYPVFELARNGTLFYVPGARLGGGRRLVVVDSQGTITPWSPERLPLQEPSAGGGLVAVTAMEPNGLLFEIWVSDHESPMLRRRVTLAGVDNHQPVLSGDGSHLAFRRYAASAQDGLYVRSLDAAGEERRLAEITTTTDYTPCSWSADGSRLIATRTHEGKSDLVAFAVDGPPGAAPQPLVNTPFNEFQGVVAPGGGALAFGSDEAGHDQIYVATLHADGSVGPAVAVSSGRGAIPRWSPDGRTLYFWDGRDHILSVPVTTSPRISAGAPEPLLDLPKLGLTNNYDVLPDGRLIVVARGEEEGEIQRLDVVLGFGAELAAAVGEKP